MEPISQDTGVSGVMVGNDIAMDFIAGPRSCIRLRIINHSCGIFFVNYCPPYLNITALLLLFAFTPIANLAAD